MSDSDSQRPRVGMLHELAADGQVIVGRDVAVEQLIAGLAAYGNHFDYRLYCPSEQTPTLAKALASEARLSVHDRRALFADLEQAPPSAWHENQFDTHRPFAVRAQSQRAYPISVVHHTISYKELRHSRILPLLLAKPHSYDTVICTSSAAQQALTALIEQVAEDFNRQHGSALRYRGTFQCIPLPIDIHRYTPLDQGAARRTFNIAPDAFVILWLGRMSILDKADLMPLLHAVAELIERNPGKPIELICAGTQRSGEQFGDVLRDYAGHLGIGSHVRVLTDTASFMPWKYQLYSAADAFVSPVDNIQETYGLTPVEAMACGVPQLVSSWDGYRDTVVDGETGFVIPTYWTDCQQQISDMALLNDSTYDHFAMAQSVVVDTAAMVHAFQTLLNSPELARKMAEASRQRAVNTFSWEAVIKQYEALWLEKSAQAQAHPEPIEDGAAYTRPRYGRTFGHYASHTLSPQTELIITAKGKRILSGEADLPSHYNARWRYLDLQVLRRLLLGLAQMTAKGKSLSIAALVEVLGRGPQGVVAAEVKRHTMWLLKYGLIGWASEPVLVERA